MKTIDSIIDYSKKKVDEIRQKQDELLSKVEEEKVKLEQKLNDKEAEIRLKIDEEQKRLDEKVKSVNTSMNPLNLIREKQNEKKIQKQFDTEITEAKKEKDSPDKAIGKSESGESKSEEPKKHETNELRVPISGEDKINISNTNEISESNASETINLEVTNESETIKSEVANESEIIKSEVANESVTIEPEENDIIEPKQPTQNETDKLETIITNESINVNSEVSNGENNKENSSLKTNLQSVDNNKQEDNNHSKKREFGNFLFLFIIIFVLVTLWGFSSGHYFAATISLLATGMLTVSLLMCLDIIKQNKPKTHILLAVIACFMMIIPTSVLIATEEDTGEINYEEFDWNSIILSDKLPKPKSNTGNILSNTSENLYIFLSKTSQKDYNNYKKKCKEMGYIVNAADNEYFYTSYNNEGYRLQLTLLEDDKELIINLDAPINNTEFVWPTYGLAKVLPIPKSKTGKIIIDNDFEFSVNVSNTSQEDYNEYTNACINKGFNIDYSKNDKLYYGDNSSGLHVSVRNVGNNTMKVDIIVIDTALWAKKQSETTTETTTIAATTINTTVATTSSAPKTPPTSAQSNNAQKAGNTQSAANTQADAVLTVNNCPELAKILSLHAEIDESYTNFSKKYLGKTIMFDGRVDYVTLHENYKTRYDMLVSAGDFDPDSQIGPTFKFKDVNGFDLGTDILKLEVMFGRNVRITAKVGDFDSESGLFFLDPVLVEYR